MTERAISFAGQEFLNTTEEGVREQVKAYLNMPVLKVLGGEFDKLSEDMQSAILDEIVGGCGSNLQMITRPQCGNLRWLLQSLTDEWLTKRNETVAAGLFAGVATAAGAAGAAAADAAPAAPATVCPPPIETPWVRTDIIRRDFPVLSDNYTEFQSNILSCGRHALNNLLGGNVYDASAVRYDAGETYRLDGDLREIQYPIDLHVLCRTVYPDISNADPTVSSQPYAIYCQRAENYDINLLMAALRIAGYTANAGKTDILKQPAHSEYNTAVNELFCESSNTKLIGFILNTGGNHWVAVKKQKDNYHYIDSLTGTPTEGTHIQNFTLSQFKVFIQQPYVAQIIKVLQPAGSTFIDPRQPLRFSIENAADALAKATAAAATGDLKAASLAALAALQKQMKTDAERTAYMQLAPALTFAIRNTTSPEEDRGFFNHIRNTAGMRLLFSPAGEEARGLLLAIRQENGNYSQAILRVLNAYAKASPPLFTLRIPLRLLLSSE
jgi:hypothetical protein